MIRRKAQIISRQSMLLGLCSLLLLTGNSHAIPFANPDPATFADDIDGTGYFQTADALTAFEIADIGEDFFVGGNTFGFFFRGADVSNPSNLIPIFGADDVVGDAAQVNFIGGVVFDIEDSAVQNIFAGSTEPIGFYLVLDIAFGPTPPLFSDPSLNAGFDLMGAFPTLADASTFLLRFTDPTGVETFGIEIVTDLRPLPEPGTMLLIGIGLLSGVVARRWRI